MMATASRAFVLMHYDKEYTDKYCNPWKIEARGQHVFCARIG